MNRRIKGRERQEGLEYKSLKNLFHCVPSGRDSSAKLGGNSYRLARSAKINRKTEKLFTVTHSDLGNTLEKKIFLKYLILNTILWITLVKNVLLCQR